MSKQHVYNHIIINNNKHLNSPQNSFPTPHFLHSEMHITKSYRKASFRQISDRNPPSSTLLVRCTAFCLCKQSQAIIRVYKTWNQTKLNVWKGNFCKQIIPLHLTNKKYDILKNTPHWALAGGHFFKSTANRYTRVSVLWNL